MSEYAFIYQHSNKQKVRVFFFSVFVFLILVALSIVFRSAIFSFDNPTALSSVWHFIKDEIAKFTPSGLFYAGLFGGSIFIPMPLEIFFWLGLQKGNPILLSFFLLNAGICLVQVVNYFIGAKLSKVVFNVISLKKVYQMRRKLNKYGAYGIFFGNLLPLIPSELITFGLGLAKYNVYRLFVFTIAGLAIKYGVIILFFLLFS